MVLLAPIFFGLFSAGKKVPEYNDDMYSQPVKSVTLMERTTQINGREINVNRWVPDGEPKAVVLISHGLHEHGRRHHGVAEVLAREKYLVIAPDHYAHGLSEGTRGLIVDYKFLIEDFVTLCKTSHDEYPLLPFFIVSHSLGTMVSVMTIKELPFLKAVVFCGCPIFAGPAASSIFGLQFLYFLSQTAAAAYITYLLSNIAPTGSAAPILQSEMVSDPAAIEVIKRDPRSYHGDIMNKSAYEMIKWIPVVKEEIPNIKIPFYCLHGGDDAIALPKGSIYLMENSGTIPSQKSISILPGLKHEVFHEKMPDGPNCVQSVLTYFETFM